MPLPPRHGLRTVALSAPGPDRRRDTALVLAGHLNHRLRRLPATEPLETTGERQLLLDDHGTSVAVLEVDGVRVVPLTALQAEGTLEPWTDEAATEPADDVAVITFHIVGSEER